MRMYVANVTKQTHIFAYRRTGVDKLQEPRISAGSQIVIEGERLELDKIVRQHRKYGIVEAADVAREARFSGIAFRFDQPIDVDSMRAAVEKRHSFENDRGLEARERTTLATDQSINQAAQEVGLPEVSTRVDIEERRAPGSPSGTAPVKQELKVDRVVAPSRKNRR